ncbi:hypothetical protein EV363DRAFT_1395178 [Boletus edulis]|uniref:Chitin-binding type-2 domain-containing protein n=1 Tax=Boletus edulis BED1 TaxID=1328754 RepID=A0AAD4BS04_BOLED|nr:hypothetical protein EV363DRAFT_1183348 [Boletus edulis]KAF8137657.1 hypothetical protein EV363DRAFT_1395178 [Boletus edulis]KAF8414780.1 hypothetical protein L210DRAFT_3658485 [Boletus edulis BED1]KAF8437936.1 hypothetical protein L210DRAFT_853840 [Boletus edulis BED1]
MFQDNKLASSQAMFHSVVSIALIFSSLLGHSTRASASCLACPNCIYDPLPNGQGNACLNYWTCSGETITCYYPSVEYPGTFTACVFTYDGSFFTLTASSPSVCDDSEIGDNSKCEPPNDPWNGACTASEAYVGEPNSGLL